jgi:VIT1/CCC1 family predicted Fe2+/Mn2+ transporter
MAMAVGVYVSVASQRDTEHADLALERKELASSPKAELEELTRLYMARGVDRDLAAQVAAQLTTNDALAAHGRDELLHESLSRPLQAAGTSAAAFSSLAVLPVIALLVAPTSVRIEAIVALALAGLVILGWLGARIGGAPWRRRVVRVLVGGTAAMAVTAAVGLITHTTGNLKPNRPRIHSLC